MIKAVMVMNKQGKISPGQILRLSAYGEAARGYSRRLFSRAENVGNFVQADSIFGSDSRLGRTHFATFYFVFVFDSSENDLAMLDLIQVFVET
ncbi:hypothetical protein SLE2022_303390 [Rubroshorea leprosula]